MTKPKLFWLTDKNTFNTRGQDIFNHLSLVVFAFDPKSHLKLLIVLKNSEANAQISSKPKVMARTVIGDDDRFYLGWTIEVQKALLSD